MYINFFSETILSHSMLTSLAFVMFLTNVFLIVAGYFWKGPPLLQTIVIKDKKTKKSKIYIWIQKQNQCL